MRGRGGVCGGHDAGRLCHEFRHWGQCRRASRNMSNAAAPLPSVRNYDGRAGRSWRGRPRRSSISIGGSSTDSRSAVRPGELSNPVADPCPKRPQGVYGWLGPGASCPACLSSSYLPTERSAPITLSQLLQRRLRRPLPRFATASPDRPRFACGEGRLLSQDAVFDACQPGRRHRRPWPMRRTGCARTAPTGAAFALPGSNGGPPTVCCDLERRCFIRRPMGLYLKPGQQREALSS